MSRSVSGLVRRGFLRLSSAAALGIVAGYAGESSGPKQRSPIEKEATEGERESIDLFLCGDVMTGRGIDQLLAHPSDPRIHESYVKSALGYVQLAEKAVGPIQRPVESSYIWGDALDELERVAPDARIINLETSVTTSDDWLPKGINYRMHPKNIPCITAAKIDCCVLANNHVLDWGRAGLAETLKTLWDAELKTAGAGRNLEEAAEPAIIEVAGKGRVLVFAFGSVTSGIPRDWAAKRDGVGVNLLRELSDRTVRRIAESVRKAKKRRDLAVASIHWGGNWGYEIPSRQRVFARRLLDEAGIDVVHGHSSHHPKGIEIYKGKPILYGCGDFINDYEGIKGYEQFRADLTLMYFVQLDPATGRLVRLEMTPLGIRRFRLNRVSMDDARWICDMLNREGAETGTRAELNADGRLSLGRRGDNRGGH
jgi:poly-gamma-glutamate synthesis protein (capsule biosynthesis protein)